jgi:hypothetical protein
MTATSTTDAGNMWRVNTFAGIRRPTSPASSGLKLPVTPAGSPATVNAMLCATPDTTAVLIVYVVVVAVPAVTTRDVGTATILRSLPGSPPPHSGGRAVESDVARKSLQPSPIPPDCEPLRQAVEPPPTRRLDRPCVIS